MWRPVEIKTAGGPKVTKPPFRSDDPTREASTTDPSTWSTFDDALACYRTYAQAGVAGVGFVFTRNDPYFGVDVDSEKKIKPENLERRQAFVRQLLARAVTYTETSPSGDGIHLIARGQLPVAGTQAQDIGVEVYGCNRFFTMTGDVLDETRTEITDQQDFADSFQYRVVAERPPVDAGEYRALDLPDEEVVRRATNANPAFAPRFNALSDCDPGEWSESLMAVVAELDRVTGSVAQIERIVKSSPIVTHAPPSGSGETRRAKTDRIFVQVLSRVREGNDARLPFVQHGREQAANLERVKRERVAEAVRMAEEAVGRLSRGSVSLLDAFPQLTSEHRVLTRPPGVVGEFVAATEVACFNPSTKFAIPAVLSSLSGIVSRGYKLPGGSGLNLNFILAAPSSTGKTQTMKAWEGFEAEACAGMPATPAGPPRTRIINSSTSSIQAMMEEFQERPACVWFVEECHAQLRSMSAGKTQVEAALRDAYNQLYDCSSHGSLFSGPRSVAARKAQLAPIDNLCVSTFWTTVPSKLDIFSEDALDGFLSRVVVIRHTGTGGAPSQNSRQLTPSLLGTLRDRMSTAISIDEAYRSGADPSRLLTTVSTDEVRDLDWQLVQTTHALSCAAITGELPPAYTSVSRLPLTAMRMAALLAIMESPYAPAVSEAQLRWSFGYLLQNLVDLLSEMDSGAIGDRANDDYEAVKRTLLRLMIKPEYIRAGGVNKADLRNDLKQRKPFKHHPTRDTHKAITQTLEAMVNEGILTKINQSTSGAPAQLYGLNAEYIKQGG